MAWPELYKVHCDGFPRHMLPAIKIAIDKNEVKWKGISMFAENCVGDFEWLGLTFRLEEFSELVNSVTLVSKPSKSDLTIIALKC